MTVRDAKAEKLSAIQVGMTLADFYEDDTMWHERLVRWPAMDGTKSWFILSPDFDIYAELFDLDGSQGPSRVRIKNQTFQYWSRFSQASYRFSEAFKKYIGEAIEEVRKAGHWDDGQVPSTMINRKGDTVSTTA